MIKDIYFQFYFLKFKKDYLVYTNTYYEYMVDLNGGSRICISNFTQTIWYIETLHLSGTNRHSVHDFILCTTQIV